MAKNETRIPLSGVTERTRQILPYLDATRRDELLALERLHAAKSSGQTRELARLRTKFGDDHPRVASLKAKIGMHRVRASQLGAELERASTPLISPDDERWVLHGRVRDTELKGLPSRSVGLFDTKGGKRFTVVQTDSSGYFKIEASVASPAKVAATLATRSAARKPVAEPTLFLHVLDTRKRTVFEDTRPLVPHGGAADYIEIVLELPK
ncbi:MAG: hypothetical protein ABJC63_07455 [Gemmatimonadales bacterium]